MDSDLARAQAV